MYGNGKFRVIHWKRISKREIDQGQALQSLEQYFTFGDISLSTSMPGQGYVLSDSYELRGKCSRLSIVMHRDSCNWQQLFLVAVYHGASTLCDLWLLSRLHWIAFRCSLWNTNQYVRGKIENVLKTWSANYSTSRKF